MAEASGLGANVGTAWVALRFSARGAKQDIEKQIDQEIGGSGGSNGGLGSAVGAKIGKNISKSIADGINLDPAVKKFTNDTGGFGRAISRIRTMFSGNGSGGNGGLAGSIDNVSKKFENFLTMSAGSGGILGLINPLTIALGALAAVISGPLLGSLLPITIGFAGFAKVATSDITKLYAAMAGGKAGKKALKALPDSLRPLLPVLRSLKSQWGQVEAAIQPTVIVALTKAIGIVKQLMPSIGPLFVAAGDAVAGFLDNVSNWLKSSSGKKFLAWLEQRGPQDIANFTKVMWDLARVVGWVFAQLVKNGNQWLSHTKEVIGGLKVAYNNMRKWIYDDFILKIVNFFTKNIPAAYKSSLKAFKSNVGEVKTAYSNMRTWIYNDFIWKIINFFIHTLPNGIRTGWDDSIKFFKSIPGKVAGALSTLKNLMFNIGNNALLGLWNGAKSIGATVVGWFKNLGSEIIRGIKGIFGIHSPSTVMFDIGKHLITGMVNGLKAHYGKVGGFFSKMGKGVTSGVQQWTGLVQRALSMLNLPQSLTGNVLYQMQTESGGNPNAINLWDSNAAAGDPSRGLMQVIGSTFAAYHVPGTSDNIYNPLANIAAAIAYAKSRYGPSLMSGGMGIGSGHGYDSGGIARGLGFLPKYTPKPERVLSPQQTNAFERLVDVLDGKSGGSGKPSRQKVEFDPRTMEMWIRDLSSQEAGSEIAFRRK